MTRDDYEALRKSPKTIEADIEYSRYEEDSDLWEFDEVEVLNTFGHEIVVNGSYDQRTGYIKFNFVLRSKVRGEGGPICRVEVNGRVHPGAGRSHKQDLREPSCPRRNLPHAIARPDMEGKNLLDVWDDICKRGKITHRGKFVPPPEDHE